jgi:hypothetical protein
MFQDMSHPGGIFRYCPEHDTESIFRVRRCNMDMPGSGAPVNQLDHDSVDGCQVVDSFYDIIAKLFAGLDPVKMGWRICRVIMLFYRCHV